jgi:hypothetical protein
MVNAWLPPTGSPHTRALVRRAKDPVVFGPSALESIERQFGSIKFYEKVVRIRIETGEKRLAAANRRFKARG